MPWRCAFESPLPQSGHLGPGCVIRNRPEGWLRRGYTRGRSLVVSAPDGQSIGSPEWLHQQHEHDRGPRVREAAPPVVGGASRRASSYRLTPTRARKDTGRQRSRVGATAPLPNARAGRAERMSPPDSKQPRQLVIDHLPGGTLSSLARRAYSLSRFDIGRRGHRGGTRSMAPSTIPPNAQYTRVKTQSGAS